MIEVSAGIIRRKDGRLLVCQRGEGQHNAHLWEFPGGKQEAGETPASCLCRELMEELALPVENISRYAQRVYGDICFTFLAGETDAEPVPTEHEDVRFVTREELLTLPFCPADAPIARRLALKGERLTCFIWDFDGTLMDTYPHMVIAMKRSLEDQGLFMGEKELLDLMKVSVPYCRDVLSEQHGLDRFALQIGYWEHGKKLDPSQVQPIPGIPETLRELRRRGGRHFVYTHRDKGTFDYLRQAGIIDEFEDIITSEDGFRRKPEPDALLHLIEKHHLIPGECVMIGDRPLDTACGRNAGMLSCMLDTEGRFSDDSAEYYTHDARLMPDLFLPLSGEG